MGKIIVTTNMSLDGIVQDPDGEERSERGGWFDRFMGADREEWARVETAETLGAEALLLGRRSDDWFATRWQSRTGTWADKLNSLPKYVVSGTLTEAKWSNGTILRGDPAIEVSKLKRELAGDILVYASYHLVQTLIEHDLVDEFRIMILPVVLGAGRRLFGETSGTKPLRLVDVTTVGKGLSFVTYEVVRDA